MLSSHLTVHSCTLLYSAICYFLTDVPPPTDGSVSVEALNEAGKVRVTWSRPTRGPGQVITGYSVQYRRRGTPSYTTRSVSGSSTTSYVITNLRLGTVYKVRVASVGPLGLSEYCCGNGKLVTTYNREYTIYIIHVIKGNISVYILGGFDGKGFTLSIYHIILALVYSKTAL